MNTIEKPTIPADQAPPHIRKRANAIARKHGCGSATSIIYGDIDRVVWHDPPGYRRKSDSAPVSSAYRRKAWSSCYYHHAETTVEIAVS